MRFPSAVGLTQWAARLRPVGIAITWIAALALLAWAARWGIDRRIALWEETASIRFQWDIGNGMNWGRRVLREGKRVDDEPRSELRDVTLRQWFNGWVATYDRVFNNAPGAEYGLDYTPLRLAVMSLWMRHVHATDDHPHGYRDELALPMLQFNRWMEGATAIFGGSLAWIWLRRADGRDRWWMRPSVFVPPIAVMIAIWLCPPLMWNTHAWPQWDVWLLPFFMLAAILGSLGWWTPAGTAVVVGAMLKGQILFAAPMLIAWPIFLGDWRGLIRLLTGAGLGVVLVTWPWLIRGNTAWSYIAIAVVVSIAVVVASRWIKRWIWLAAGLAMFIALAWPVLNSTGWPLLIAVVVAGLVIAAARCSMLQLRVTAVLIVLVVTSFIAAVRFDGSFSWYHVGFEYPGRHYPRMIMGPTSNLPAILHLRYGWEREDVLTIWGIEQPIKDWLRQTAVVGGALAGLALAMNQRRRCRTGLVAFAAPFILFFAIVPQMHERYLLWGAVVGCLALAGGLRMMVLGLVVIAISWTQMLHQQLPRDPNWSVETLRLTSSTHPDIGWAVALAALVWLAMSFPARRDRPVSSAPVGMPAASVTARSSVDDLG
jgi:hypothetical protein